MGNCESSAGCLWVKYYIVAGKVYNCLMGDERNMTLLNFL